MSRAESAQRIRPGTTTEVVQPVKPVSWVAVVAASTVGALAFAALGLGIVLPAETISDTPMMGFVPVVLGLAGALAGSGAVFLISEASGTRTEVTYLPPSDSSAPDSRDAFPVAQVLEGTFKNLKDLSTGKTLVVLSVALVALAMWTVSPDSPDAPGSGTSQQGD